VTEFPDYDPNKGGDPFEARERSRVAYEGFRQRFGHFPNVYREFVVHRGPNQNVGFWFRPGARRQLRQKAIVYFYEIRGAQAVYRGEMPVTLVRQRWNPDGEDRFILNEDIDGYVAEA
jgi:hypothetical protein